MYVVLYVKTRVDNYFYNFQYILNDPYEKNYYQFNRIHKKKYSKSLIYYHHSKCNILCMHK